MNCVYLCIDLKSFYASVECVERNLDPMNSNLVVADDSRGVGAICLAVSPAMKKLGVKNRCRLYEIPRNIDYIVAKPRMKKYIDYSSIIYGIYLNYFDKKDIHVYSIDEVFINITPYLNLYNMTPIQLTESLKDKIYKKTGITSSAGIGTNLFLAKVALDILAKRSFSGIAYLDEETYKKELWDHRPLTDFWQIGKGIEKRLNKLYIYTMHDISITMPNKLYKEFGVLASILIEHANGREITTIDDIKRYKPQKNSLTLSQTLMTDYNYQNARKVLIEMIDNGCLSLVERRLSTQKVLVIIGYSKGRINPLKISISLSWLTTNYSKIINKVLKEYDAKVNCNISIRKITICFETEKFINFHQLDLFSNYEEDEADKALSLVINNLKNRYGKNILLRGVSYDKYATARNRNKMIGGHNAE